MILDCRSRQCIVGGAWAKPSKAFPLSYQRAIRKRVSRAVARLCSLPLILFSDGEVPIDNLASERALRTFTIGRKNWMTINTVRGADASAIIYSVTETARANGLNVYYYMKHLLTELTRVVRADGSIDEKELEPLMPWSKDLPAECYKRRK